MLKVTSHTLSTYMILTNKTKHEGVSENSRQAQDAVEGLHNFAGIKSSFNPLKCLDEAM